MIAAKNQNPLILSTLLTFDGISVIPKDDSGMSAKHYAKDPISIRLINQFFFDNNQ